MNERKCDRIINVLSEKLPLNDSWCFQVISFNGCASLSGFIEHLDRNNCKDFNTTTLKNVLGECENEFCKSWLACAN